MQKAEILAEIELFYLLPHQRRWKTWFPEVIHYYADVDKTRYFELNDNEVMLEKLKSHDEKLEKLDKLEKLEEKLEKLEKLLEEKHAK
ncbi:unnamed protein product [Rhizophagus irregularis]|nr:unnamed protein product [Rhizophagus irregularis]